MLSLTRIHLAIVIVVTLIAPTCLLGQDAKPELKPGIIGTAVDIDGDPVPNATVELKSLDSTDPHAVTTGESGSFEFRGVQPGVPYEITHYCPGGGGEDTLLDSYGCSPLRTFV
jgi:hypothetical protein